MLKLFEVMDIHFIQPAGTYPRMVFCNFFLANLETQQTSVSFRSMDSHTYTIVDINLYRKWVDDADKSFDQLRPSN